MTNYIVPLIEHPIDTLVVDCPRVLDLRNQLLKLIPRQPSNQETLNILEKFSINQLFCAYMNWVDRFIPPRKRKVSVWDGFWAQPNSGYAAHQLREMVCLSKNGGDLTPYLSKKIHSEGYIQTTSNKRKISWSGKDMAINAYGLHHIHLNPYNKNGNRNGTSDELVFVDVFRAEIVLVMLGDHKSFDDGSLFQTATNYKAETGWDIKGIRPPRENPNPVEQQLSVRHGLCSSGVSGDKLVATNTNSTAGTSIFHTQHADKCCELIETTEKCLADGQSLASLFGIDEDGFPNNTNWSWSFWYGDLILTDRNSEINILVAKWRR